MENENLKNVKCPLCNVEQAVNKIEKRFDCRACKIKLGVTGKGHVYINKKGKASLQQNSTANRQCPDCKNLISSVKPNSGRYTICSNCGLWIDNLEVEESIMEDDSKYFCSDCEGLLPLPNINSKYIKCQYCNLQTSTSVFKEETYAEYTFNKIKPPLSEENMSSRKTLGPMVDQTCPKCYHEGMIYNTLQTRSVDEGQTVFYLCPECGFRDVENS